MLFLFPQVQAIKLLVRWLLGMKNNQSRVGKLHPAPVVSHAGQRGRPHGAEEDQVTQRLKVVVELSDD